MPFAEDLTEYFDTSYGFAAAATYNGTTTVNGIFDDEYFEDSPGFGPGGESSKPSFLCRAADVAGATPGQTLAVNGITYHIVNIQPDGTGLTRLILEKQ